MPCAANISTAQLWDLPLPLPALEFAFFCHLDWSGHFFSCARLERCPRNGEILARLLRHRSTIEIRLALNFASANAASASFSTLPPPTQHRLTLNFASANAASAWLRNLPLPLPSSQLCLMPPSLPLPSSGICFFLSSRLERTVFSCARPERCPRNGEILARLLRHRST